MQTIFIVIRDNGDGSQSLNWFNNCTYEELEKTLEESNDFSWQSGDGIQITELKFPDDFNIYRWAKNNYITLLDKDEYDNY